MLESLAQVVRDNGGPMTFDAFRDAARLAGLRPEMWLKAKHAGLIYVYRDVNGVLTVSVTAPVTA